MTPLDLAASHENRLDIDLLSRLERRYRGEPKRVVVDAYSTTVTMADLKLLKDEVWLNDTVIMFWLSWWAERIGAACTAHRTAKPTAPPVEGAPRSWIYNTFFYKKLSEKGGFKNVQTWLPQKENIDLFKDLDLILVPVNVVNNHWYLAVIDFRTKSTRVYDSLNNGSTHAGTHARLQGWLADAWDAQNPDTERYDLGEWRVEAPDANRPTQDNSYDCGVFTCLYAAYLTLNKPFNFSQADMAGVRVWMVQLIYQFGALKHDEAKKPAKTHVDKTFCHWDAAPYIVAAVARNTFRLEAVRRRKREALAIKEHAAAARAVRPRRRFDNAAVVVDDSSSATSDDSSD